MRIHFSVSEAQIEPNELTGIPPIDPDQVAFMVIEADDIQMTYSHLRVGEHGQEIAALDPETYFWEITRELEPIILEDHRGEPHTEVARTTGLKFTDWTVAP